MITWACWSLQFGRTAVYVVDEHGCLMNDEPVAIVNSDAHPWFAEWLKAQPCPYSTLPLLWHPALGESYETYQAKVAGAKASA